MGVISEKPVAVAATVAAVAAALGMLAVWPASDQSAKKGAKEPEAATAKQTSTADPSRAKPKKNVLRLIPDPEPESPSKRGIVRRQSTPMLNSPRPNKTSGDNDKWLGYRHENDSHPPMESSWISYAHEGDEYQGDKHDTNRNPALGDSWVLPSPSSSLHASKSTPKLRQEQSIKNLRPPPAALKDPAPPVPTTAKDWSQIKNAGRASYYEPQEFPREKNTTYRDCYSVSLASNFHRQN